MMILLLSSFRGWVDGTMKCTDSDSSCEVLPLPSGLATIAYLRIVAWLQGNEAHWIVIGIVVEAMHESSRCIRKVKDPPLRVVVDWDGEANFF